MPDSLLCTIIISSSSDAANFARGKPLGCVLCINGMLARPSRTWFVRFRCCNNAISGDVTVGKSQCSSGHWIYCQVLLLQFLCISCFAGAPPGLPKCTGASNGGIRLELLSVRGDCRTHCTAVSPTLVPIMRSLNELAWHPRSLLLQRPACCCGLSVTVSDS